MDHPQVTLHGTCVAIGGKGVLILGPPSSGKSSLALRVLDEPGYGLSKSLMAAELVSDPRGQQFGGLCTCPNQGKA